MPDDLNDGSLDAAVRSMPDVDSLPPPISFEDAQRGVTPPRQVPQPREQNGQWAERERALAAREAELNVRSNSNPGPLQKAAIDEAAPVDAAGEEENWIEIPPEKEGGEPRRLKVDDVWQGYQEREALKEEIEKVRRGSPPPIEYDREIYQTVQARGNLVRMAQQYEAMLQPPQPNMDLINPGSPNYNPEAYHRQMQLAQEMGSQLHAIRQNRAALEAEQARDQEALHRAKHTRERGKVMEIWPELSKEATARDVRNDLHRFYGVDDETLNSIVDARFYALAKDALAYRQGLKAQSAAIRVVKSKPKLIKGSARDTGNQKQNGFDGSMRRLQESNSIDDAADAIGRLIS